MAKVIGPRARQPGASSAGANTAPRHALNDRATFAAVEGRGITTASSSGRPDASRHSSRSALSGSSSRTDRRRAVFAAPISVRSWTCPQRSVRASPGRRPA